MDGVEQDQSLPSAVLQGMLCAVEHRQRGGGGGEKRRMEEHVRGQSQLRCKVSGTQLGRDVVRRVLQAEKE